MNRIYLDHNGSSPVAAEVIDAMRPWFGECQGNPSSAHFFGRKGRDAIEHARGQIAALINCASDEIIFTSGGTESNNLALKGVAEAKGQGTIITVATEHPSVLKTAQYLATRGYGLAVAGVDHHGIVAPSAIEELLDDHTILVSVMLANNEVGNFQPVREIAAHTRNHGTLLHCDAGQVVGKEKVDVEELGVDLMTIAGHKFNAPKGIGALYVRKGTTLAPQLHGAGHERGLRSGTQDVLEIVGLGAAAERFHRHGTAITGRYRALRDVFDAEISEKIPKATLNGPRQGRLVNTSNFAFPGVSSGELLAQCPEIACAPGAACHKDHTTPSHVLAAMGVADEQARSSIRFSLGHGTTEEELRTAVELLKNAVSRLLSDA